MVPVDTCLQDYHANAARPFASARLWGSWCFFRMYKKQERLIAMNEGRLEDPEPAVMIVEETKDGQLAIVPREEPSRGESEIEPATYSRIS